MISKSRFFIFFINVTSEILGPRWGKRPSLPQPGYVHGGYTYSIRIFVKHMFHLVASAWDVLPIIATLARRVSDHRVHPVIAKAISYSLLCVLVKLKIDESGVQQNRLMMMICSTIHSFCF